MVGGILPDGVGHPRHGVEVVEEVEVGDEHQGKPAHGEVEEEEAPDEPA